MGNSEWHEPAMRLFEAYWDDRLGKPSKGDDWKDDQRFADRLEEMVCEMESSMPSRIMGVTFEQLHIIVEKIRERA